MAVSIEQANLSNREVRSSSHLARGRERSICLSIRPSLTVSLARSLALRTRVTVASRSTPPPSSVTLIPFSSKPQQKFSKDIRMNFLPVTFRFTHLFAYRCRKGQRFGQRLKKRHLVRLGTKTRQNLNAFNGEEITAPSFLLSSSFQRNNDDLCFHCSTH